MAKKILLVGGNSGVGEQIRDRQLGAGDEVFCASRERGGIVDSEHCHWQAFDVTDPAQTLDLPEVLDGFVYCPGSISLKPFARLTDDDFQRDLEVNYLGCSRALRLALPSLKRSKGASIVLFSTVAVQTGLPFHASIAGAKGAVEGFARALAAELSPAIRVNCLALSLTDTPMADFLLNSEAKRQASAERHPLKRVGDSGEVADAAKFFLGEESGFVTGQVLQIDGGMSSLKLL
jgi:NAD(P)-dependent dehydrogenase (short-subunit alcohol dehydrogenase family)